MLQVRHNYMVIQALPTGVRCVLQSKAKRAQAGMAGCGVGDESERIWLVPSTLKELLQALQSNDGECKQDNAGHSPARTSG